MFTVPESREIARSHFMKPEGRAKRDPRGPPHRHGKHDRVSDDRQAEGETPATGALAEGVEERWMLA